jgi:hypothetical protein
MPIVLDHDSALVLAHRQIACTVKVAWLDEQTSGIVNTVHQKGWRYANLYAKAIASWRQRKLGNMADKLPICR